LIPGPARPGRHVIQTYARRMNIEQRLAEAIQSFGLDALAGAVPLNVDLDVVLSDLAHTVCAALRGRLPGYHAATPDTLERQFLNTGGIIEHHRGQTTIRLNRRTYSPVLRQADLLETITVPWWGSRTLRYQYDMTGLGAIRLVKIGAKKTGKLSRPRIVGVVNITEDSFSEAGCIWSQTRPPTTPSSCIITALRSSSSDPPPATLTLP
jgi:hypothetical protein